MSCYIMLVWIWLLLDRDIIMRIFSAGYCQRYASHTKFQPNELPEPIKVSNKIKNPGLIKMKINTGPEPVSYDIFLHNLILYVLPVACVKILHMDLFIMCFLYLIW